MKMPLQFSTRLMTLTTGALLSSTLIASLACANTGALSGNPSPNTDASVMSQSTPTGDSAGNSVSREPASETESSTTTMDENEVYETDREPASVSAPTTNTGVSQTQTKKKTKSTTTESSTSESGAADTAVPEVGTTNRDMSQAGPPDTDFSGTSYGIDEYSESDRSPASANGSQSGGSNSNSNDQTTTDRQKTMSSNQKQQRHQSADQQRQVDEVDVFESRRPADGAAIVIVRETEQTEEPELSSRLSALGAPKVQIDRKNNPARSRNDAFDTEPYSGFPGHIGSTQVTGKDKSVAVLEQTDLFTDLNALSRNGTTRDATAKLQDVDMDKFSYNRRAEFQSVMTSRLNNVGRTIDDLNAKAIENTDMTRSDLEAVITDLGAQRDSIVKTVDFADTVNRENWDSYRDSFRRQLADLEGSVAQLSSALR